MPGNKPWLAVGLMLLFAAVYFYQDPEWNGNSRLNLTRAIVERGSLQIDAYQSAQGWSTEDTAYFNGHYYTDKAVGSSLLAVPLYFLLYNLAAILQLQLDSSLIKHMLTSMVLGISFAAGGIAMYRSAEKLGAAPRMSLIATLGVALGTMLWPYSAVYYGHALAATFLIIAFYLLLSVRVEPQRQPAVRLFGAGLALGLAFITEYTTALIIVGLLVYAAYALKGRSLRAVASLALMGFLGALIPLAIMFSYNAAVFGSPLAFGYSYEVSNTFQQGMSAGLMGIHIPRRSVLFHITLDPKFGLFWQSPVLLLASVGYFLLFRRRGYLAEGLISAYAIGVMLLMNAGYYLWWGGHAFGPRLIIPALPFFVIPLAFLPGALEIPTLLLGALSIGQMLIPLMGQIQPNIDFKDRLNSFFAGGTRFDGFSLMYQYGLPLIPRRLHDGVASWNLATGVGLPYWLSVPVLVAVEAVMVVLHLKSARALTAAGPRPVEDVRAEA